MKFRNHPQALILNEIIALGIVFAFVIVGVVLSRVNPDYYLGVYAIEDGLIEWLTAIGLLFGAGICFYRSIILKPFRPKLFRICSIILGLILVFGFLEEISYGQRIFGYSTPDSIAQHNTQGEFNIHNLEIGGVRINKAIFGLGLTIIVIFYFIVMPFLYRRFEKVKTWCDSLAIPVPKWAYTVAYLLLFLLTELIPFPEKGEVLEFGGVWIFILMMIRPYNREIFSRRSLSY